MIRTRGASAVSLLPGLVLVVISVWFGTLPGGATWWGAALGYAGILALAWVGAPDWRDPLGLGQPLGLLLPIALVAAAATSWCLSPVGRAGIVGTLLLPAFLLAPAGVARCWREPRQLRIGLCSLALVVVLVSGWGLVEWYRQQSPRPAMPLGHHNLLAGWLVLLLPLASVGLARTGTWRWLSAVALAVGAGVILATQSLLGIAALTLQGLLAALWWPSLRLPLAAAMGIAALTQASRGLRILNATDLSARARWIYLHAAWEGLVERPALGWGPGSTPWLIAGFLKPDRGVNPASEIVGDFHSLPAQLAFELGLTGLVLGTLLWLLFFARRWLLGSGASSGPIRSASLLGLAGGTVYFAGNAPITILALPAACIVTAGVALAASPDTQTRGSRPRLPFTLLYLLPAMTLLLPKLLAQAHYDHAASCELPSVALEEIRWATDLDPAFPLYGARTAWLQGSLYGVDDHSAGLALQAAEAARGVAPLWLAAGFMGVQASTVWSTDALSVARDLDPLSPLPPFLMALSQPEHPEAAHWASGAILFEPRLALTAPFLAEPELRRRTFEALSASPEGEGLVARLQATTPPGERLGALGLSIDRAPALAFSLYGFRRRPWPATLIRLPLGQ